MANYVFYTDEGFTMSPNNTKLDNLQVLGAANGSSLEGALTNLIENNPWINESGFNKEKIKHHKILNKQDENNLKSILEYMWDDEQTHFEEFDDEKPKDHIYLKLKKLTKLLH